MEPLIEPRHYRDPDILDRELSSIFADCWIFGGFKTDIACEDDWFTTRIGRDSLIVQNCGGTIRAFRNVCSHRFSRICGEEKGSGVLRCPYHGWQYDHEGIPCAIPKKPRFPELDAAKLRELALDRYQLDTCGDLIFVRKNPEGQSLRDYLGETWPVLESISLALGDGIDREQRSIRANWKINVENTLEAYHVGFVHGNTFVKTGLQELGFQFMGMHSSVRSDYSEKMNAHWNKVKSKLVSTYPQDGYLHLFIFPNLLVAGSYGLSFVLSTFMPDSPSTSDFDTRLFQVRLADESPGNMGLLSAMMDSVKSFNREVFSEDVSICEKVQKGSNEAVKKGILSDEELRICAFQTEYGKWLRPDDQG